MSKMVGRIKEEVLAAAVQKRLCDGYAAVAALSGARGVCLLIQRQRRLHFPRTPQGKQFSRKSE